VRYSLSIALLLAALLAAAGCAGTQAQLPAPTQAPPTLAPLSAPTDTPVLEGLFEEALAPDEWGLVPIDVRAYLVAVEPYTSPLYILYTSQMSPEGLDATVATLEALDVPPEMQAAHETLLKGFRTVADGRHLAREHIGDNELQAEARSQTDFGQLLLREHVQIVSAYLASLRATPVP